MELAPFNIAVIVVQVGAIKTNIGEVALKSIIETNNSVYAPLIEYIKARAVALAKIRHRPKNFQKCWSISYPRQRYPKLFVSARESIRMPFYKLPVDLVDHLMSKVFGLDKLK